MTAEAVEVHVCAMSLELHIPTSASLKAKRMVIRAILDGARERFRVATAEVEYQDQWQRARLGFAAVAGSPAQVEEVLDKVERFVWSNPAVEVIATERRWLESED